MNAVGIVLESSLRASPLLAAALLYSAMRPRTPPSLRHAVVAFGLLGFLSVPILHALMPAVSLPVIPDIGVVEAAPVDRVTATALFFAIWGGGSLLLLGHLLLGSRSVARLRRAALRQGRVYPLGRGRRVRLVLTAAVEAPLTLGLFQPLVLLPADARAWPREQRRAVVAHEIAHVRRGDGWLLLIASIVKALHWTNPLVWVGLRRMRRYSEEACDQAALRETVEPLVYAEALVSLAREARGRLTPAFTLDAASASGLGARVEAILGTEHRSHHTAEAPALAVILLALAAVVAVVAPPADPAARYAAAYGIEEGLADQILRAAAAERLAPGLAFGLVSVESRFDPETTSPRGAVGLTQILPSTATLLDPAVSSVALREPEVNLRLGFRLLRGYITRYAGDQERALLAYNVGPATLERSGPGFVSDYPRRVLRDATRADGP